MKNGSESWRNIFKRAIFWFGVIINSVFLLMVITQFVIYRNIHVLSIALTVNCISAAMWYFLLKIYSKSR